MKTAELSSEVRLKLKSERKPLKNWWKNIMGSWQLYVLFALPLAYLIIFKYYPMYGAQIAFKDFVPVKGINGSEWVGLKHFERFINSYQFWRVMKNTLGIALYQIVLGFPIPIILALSLNYVKQTQFKKSVQMITYAPHFISVVVMVGMILEFLDPRRGLINKFVELLGGDAVNFMGNPAYFKTIYVLSDVWQNTGWGCIIYLAALAGISPTLHEAAVMDGANKLQRIRHVDLPGILPIAIVLLILSVGRALDVGFEKVLLLQNPINGPTSEVIDTYVYKVGLISAGLNFSYAAAIGLFKSIINLILLVFVNSLSKKVGQESLW